MNFELQLLFEFQFVIMDMQKKIIEARLKKVDESKLKESIERVDKLIEIYKNFDKYYYQAFYYKEKTLKLEYDNQQMANRVLELTAENDKLLKTINFS